MIKNIIYVEDGSIDVDDLLESLDETTRVIIYRQGSTPPILVQPENPVNDLFDGEIAKLKNQLRSIRKELGTLLEYTGAAAFPIKVSDTLYRLYEQAKVSD